MKPIYTGLTQQQLRTPFWIRISSRNTFSTLMDGGPVMALDLSFQHREGGHPNRRHFLAQVGNQNP